MVTNVFHEFRPSLHRFSQKDTDARDSIWSPNGREPARARVQNHFSQSTGKVRKASHQSGRAEGLRGANWLAVRLDDSSRRHRSTDQLHSPSSDFYAESLRNPSAKLVIVGSPAPQPQDTMKRVRDALEREFTPLWRSESISHGAEDQSSS